MDDPLEWREYLICAGVVYGLLQMFVVMGYPTAITRGGSMDLGNKKLEWLSRGVMSRFGLRGSHMPLRPSTMLSVPKCSKS
jgi:hypothetical protein